ncbi:MAG TPA: sulfate/molybdate ABC transporter ATP-binding protein [Reyranella sp.]|jgi:sulfate transport system ATP-binding protein|nr:sulfate/molybdate ABC transporter ATP-binding protein [Reyranella sp.]
MDIRILGVSKEFGRTGALRGLDLEIRSGELIALLGPSGSGKTTLLRIVAGLEFPTAGHVYFGEEDATGLAVQERQIGFVFQHYALFRHMTVFDNVAYGLRVRRRGTTAEIAERVRELLDLVQLAGIEARYPRQLSGGQRQRVALARALAVDPRVLLLDEPFGALDARIRRDLRRWLRELHGRTRHTTVFVTHDQEEALELADRVAILNNGRIEQIGTADDIYDRPATAFVMSFVGETSCVPVEFDGHRLRFQGQPFEACLLGPHRGSGLFYVRPRDVELTAPAASSICGVVKSVHRTATGLRAQIAPGAADGRIEVELESSANIKAGSSVGLRFLRGRLFEARD